ncbi:MAG: FAD-dependent oxidoreductase, partial [Gemmataceae bacterium]
APLLSLLQEMGVVEGTGGDGEPAYAEHVLCRDPHERLFARGEWHDGLWLAGGASAEDEAQRQRFFAEVDRWVGWRDGRGRKAFALPSRTGSDDRDVMALDRLSMGDWVRERRFTSPRLLWQIDYGCRDDYGARPDDVSAWAGLFYFASRRRAPGAEPQPLLTWPEGNGKLVNHLARGVPVRTGVAVAEVIPRGRGVDVVGLTAGGQALGWRADRVIFAAPRFLAPFVIRGYPRGPGFTYGSWMVANLHLSARPREDGHPLCWDNVIQDSRSLGYVVATHQQGVDHGPTVLTYYYPLCDADADAGRRLLYSLGRDEWAELALSDLERAHPDLRPLVTRVDVMRWGHAMVRPAVGFRGARREGEYRGVRFAHSDAGGLPLFEEAFDAGARAAHDLS